MTKHVKSVLLWLTPDTVAAVDEARRDVSRSQFVEDILTRDADVEWASDRLGIDPWPPERPSVGNPAFVRKEPSEADAADATPGRAAQDG